MFSERNYKHLQELARYPNLAEIFHGTLGIPATSGLAIGLLAGIANHEESSMKFLHLFHKEVEFGNIERYDDIKHIVRRALSSEENYNLLLCRPPTSAKTLFLLGIWECRVSTSMAQTQRMESCFASCSCYADLVVVEERS